jgi:hypothetical protein
MHIKAHNLAEFGTRSVMKSSHSVSSALELVEDAIFYLLLSRSQGGSTNELDLPLSAFLN